MSSEPDVVDAEVVEEQGGELVTTAIPPALFRTEDPVEILEAATRVADALKGVVSRQGLVANIGGKEYPKVEAWQTLGAMLGAHAVPLSEPRPLPWPSQLPPALRSQYDDGLTFGFTASYEVRKAGAVVGGGSARCVRTEDRWASSDDFAISSMAQTRAISKALSGPLRFVMTLAGYEATPAEEMPVDSAAPTLALATEEQLARVRWMIAYVIGVADDQDAHVGHVLNEIRTDNGGQTPELATRAIWRLANARKVYQHEVATGAEVSEKEREAAEVAAEQVADANDPEPEQVGT